MIGFNGGLLGKPRSVYTNKGIWTPNEQRLSLFDPYWDSVSLLLHMDGSNGSATFTDSSKNALTVTANGNAQISTAQSKFGGTSGYFDGTGDYLTCSPGAAFVFGSNSFTIESWVRFSASGLSWYIIDARNSSQTGAWALLYDNSINQIMFFNGSAATGRSFSPSINVWYHIAFTRSSQTCQFYIDGTALGASYVDSTNLNVSPLTSYIGARYTGLDAINGYLDDLRVTKGVARYTADFTPPTRPFPDA